MTKPEDLKMILKKKNEMKTRMNLNLKVSFWSPAYQWWSSADQWTKSHDIEDSSGDEESGEEDDDDDEESSFFGDSDSDSDTTESESDDEIQHQEVIITEGILIGCGAPILNILADVAPGYLNRYVPE